MPALTGSTARPSGTVKLTATGLRARSGPGRGVPPASITANATLNGTEAQVDAQLHVGSSQLKIAGRRRSPPPASGPARQRHARSRDGQPDPGRRRTAGSGSIDTGHHDRRHNCRPTRDRNGTACRRRGAGCRGRTSSIGHRCSRAGRRQYLRIAQFSAKAGPGTLGGGGSIGVLSPGVPLDLTLTAAECKTAVQRPDQRGTGCRSDDPG